jgi:polysaccharide biosynthesis protein PslG
MRARLAAVLVLLPLLALPQASVAASPPPGFIGISPQNALSDEDFGLMERAGIGSIRLPMAWPAIQAKDRSLQRPNWSGFDDDVRRAAEREIEVFPFLHGTPAWVAGDSNAEPVETAWQRWGWSTFLRDAVGRYGPEGSFWEENPELPFIPIRRWEIWNEENLVTFAHRPNPVRFARLIRLSGRVLHAADPGSKVIVGGLFGRPLQIPPNVQSGDFLSRLYRARRVKRFFDGVALHPYVASAGAMVAQIENLRRIMRIHQDAATPLLITELGWGSNSNQSRWEKGPYGQANELDRAFSLLTSERRRWRIGGVWWFSWIDQSDACQFCDSAGLLTAAREAKPSWYRFNAWTGGDPDTVPRALFPFG